MRIVPRTLGRALAVQSLYGAAFSGLEPLEVLKRVARMGGLTLLQYQFDDEQIPTELLRIPVHPSTRRSAERYAQQLLNGVSTYAAMIDPLIERHLIGWSRERVGRLEWAILQTAICEMIFLKTVDPPVAIDQAVILANWLGQEESARFVNGVLDAIARSTASAESGAADHGRL